jgi:hypothetical protein
MASRLLLLGSLVAAFEDDEASMLLAHRMHVHEHKPVVVSTVAASESIPEPVLSTVEAPACHDGSSHVTSVADCWAACARIFPSEYADPRHRNFERVDLRWPNGCYVHDDDTKSTDRKHCNFNIHDQSKPPPKTTAFHKAQSICFKDKPIDKSIEVIGLTSKQTWANSKGNFYIKFPGDPNEYSLYSGGDDFVKGQTDVWPLIVNHAADLKQPTIFIKEHNDAWIPQEITIKEGGNEVFKANGLKAIIDGNCKSSDFQWGGLFCAKSITWPFVEVTVTVTTHTGTWANSNSKIYLEFEGDRRKYKLDDPKKNDFEKGNTDTFKLYVEHGSDVSAGVTLSIGDNDGWVPTSITVEAGGVTHDLNQAGTAKLPFWLDGNCPSSGKQKLSGAGDLECRSSYTFN